MKIQIFTSSDSEDLQNNVNMFIDQPCICTKSITMTECRDSWTVMVVYESAAEMQYKTK